MKKYYWAAFIPAIEGGFDIVIPDIPNCFTCADTLPEAFEMAEDVLGVMLRDLVEDKKEVPDPTDLDAVRAKTAEHLLGIDHAPAGEILYQLIPAPSLDMVPVKVTISLPRSVLESVDNLARQAGYTRSGFLAHAASVYEGQHI